MRKNILLAAIFFAGALLAETNAVSWRVPLYTLNARSMAVREALETFGVAEGIPVIMSEAVTGTFSGTFKDVPAAEFLDKIATIHNLVWYYDGASVYVNSSGETVSILQDLRYMKADDVLAMLRELGVEDSRFPIKTAQNGELIMVSGPPRYVHLVVETIAMADRLKESRTFNEVEVRLFPLRNTWADNTTFSVSAGGGSASITGVAYLLEDIMNAGGKIRATTNSLDQADWLQEEMSSEFKPVIRPENRLNAVMVRDVATRMPMYEKLIKQLDQPQKLVEVGVTVVELSKNDALDWQLSLAVQQAKNRNSLGAGLNVDNLMGTDSLEGRGLSGAYSYLGKNINLDMSLSTLKQKGKARNISRTSLLTLNNIGASLSDKHTYSARVIGEKVASLESVSAGTTLTVKPRIVDPAPAMTNVPRQIWLSLELKDGGFDAVAVENLPMTSETTLQTQAAVFEDDSLLLAGYFRDVETKAGWGIPFLRDIPIIGWLFGGSSKVKETVQRLFIITPRVVEMGTPDDVSRRTLRQRDIQDIEMLESDIDHEDDMRRLRRLDLDARREARRQQVEEQYDRRSAEIKRDERERELEHRKVEDKLENDIEAWKEELDRKEDAYRREVEQKDAEAKNAKSAEKDTEKAAKRAREAIEDHKPVEETVAPQSRRVVQEQDTEVTATMPAAAPVAKPAAAPVAKPAAAPVKPLPALAVQETAPVEKPSAPAEGEGVVSRRSALEENTL